MAFAVLGILIVLAGIAYSDPTRERRAESQPTNVLSLLIALPSGALFLLCAGIYVSAIIQPPRSPDAGGYVLLYMPLALLSSAGVAAVAVFPKRRMYGRRLALIVASAIALAVIAALYAIYARMRMTGRI
jgi:hypothetical protein